MEKSTNLSLSQRIHEATRRQWTWFTILSLLWIAFSFWAENLWLLLFILLFFDMYITKFIPWTWWKNSKNKAFRKTMEWVDAIVFALIAVYFINSFVFQNYQIPTPSLEKSLLVGDFLAVSKMSYGPRVPMTPLSFPLAQHTMPIIGGKSYFDKPQWKYRRLKGFGNVERNDIVVFNFPAGDTVAMNVQQADFYTLSKYDPMGSAGVRNNPAKYGKIVFRPVDRRENYVKRCIGMPGETIQIKDDKVFINGKYLQNAENAEQNYMIQTDGALISESVFQELGVSKSDYLAQNEYGEWFDKAQDLSTIDTLVAKHYGFKFKNGTYGKLYAGIPLTNEMVNKLKLKPFILTVIKEKEEPGMSYYYPLNYETQWTRNNFGPLWIPKKGTTLTFDGNVAFKVAAYERCIKNYEGNNFEYKNGKVFINGKQVNSYTFTMDYYFMMGDNRDNSADSRVWGFVPENHIVGKPVLIWLSLNKDKVWFNGKIRWNRIFTSAKR